MPNYFNPHNPSELQIYEPMVQSLGFIDNLTKKKDAKNVFIFAL